MLLTVATGLCAQMKERYRQADRFMVSNMWEAVGSRSVEPKFIPKSDLFWYSYKTHKGTELYLVNAKTGRQTPLLDKPRLAANLGKITGRSYDLDKTKLFPRFEDDSKSFLIDIDGKRIRVKLGTMQCTEVPLPKREPFKPVPRKEQMSKRSTDSLYNAYCIGHNLYIEHAGGRTVQVSDNGCAEFSYSDDDYNRDSVLFTTRGTWIPGTHYLYVLREDHRGMGTLPVVASVSGARPRLVTSITGGNKFAMPGDKHVTQYELSIVDAQQGKLVRVPLDKWKDQTLKLLHTTRDGRYLYVQRTRRTCDELDVCRVEVPTGRVEVVLNEMCKPYFSDRMQFIKFVNDEKDFIWWSERTGWGHFYLYAADGTPKGALTSGEWMAERIVYTDEARRKIYFIGHGREQGVNPYYSMLYRTDLFADGKTELLTPENAHHEVVFAPSGNYFVDNYSRVDLAPASVLRDTRGRKLSHLADTDLSTLYAMGWKMPETFCVKAADGVTDLYGVMWKPFDFDSSRKYPIISYVYPGPQQEAVPFAFTATGDHNAALAQLGFIVVGLGHRGGSPLRGLKYRTYGYGNLRDYPLADDKHAIEQLAARHPYIDLSRVGIFGHSGGGFMAATALMTYPDFYKAAVASSGNHDNNIFHKEWGETFHGVKQEVVRGDTVFSCKIPTNLDLAKNLKGHLLLVTGDEDNNVHPGHTLRLANALIKAGKRFDMLMLPGQGHLYKGEGADYWRRRIWFHFVKYLLHDGSADYYTDMREYMKQTK